MCRAETIVVPVSPLSAPRAGPVSCRPGLVAVLSPPSGTLAHLSLVARQYHLAPARRARTITLPGGHGHRPARPGTGRAPDDQIRRQLAVHDAGPVPYLP